MINFQSLDIAFPEQINTTVLIRWIQLIAQQHGKHAAELTFLFCSDERLLEINQKYLAHDYYTDIITFNLSENPQILRGEIYISLDRVGDNAKNASQSFENELYRVISHGVLHLIGYDDQTHDDRQLMRSREDYCLSLLP
ncbi:MAG TPA: rRNA maturation RNase YbeY [Bacteroidales bacterium]|nr:rRNA maturation RNase YbeY [Bacteroidales bacterium]